MIKKILVSFLLPLVSLFSHSTYALGFIPPPNDVSYAFLSSIFGSVAGVLPYTEQIEPMLKGPLVELNYAVMILGGVFILYALIVSTIKTAHEGEMLGRQWNSVWIPIRSALGVALLLPAGTTKTATTTYAGYSLVQAIVMWIVVQGISLADTVWANVACALYSGEAVTVGNPTMGAYTNADVDTAMGSLFTDLVCSAGLASIENLPIGVASTLPTTHKDDTVINFTDTADTSKTKFDDGTPCGYISYPTITSSSNNQTIAMASSVTEAINGLTPAAVRLVTDIDQAGILTVAQQTDLEKAILNQSASYVSAVSEGMRADQEQNQGSNHDSDNPFGNLDSYCGENGQPVDNLNAFGGGWLMAGAYYISLSKQSHNNATDKIPTPKVDRPSSSMVKGQLGQDDYQQWQLYITNSETIAANALANLNTNYNTLNSYIPDYSNPPNPFLMKNIIQNISNTLKIFLTNIGDLFTGSDCGIKGLREKTLSQCNPIVHMQRFGNSILDLLELIYVTTLIGWIAFGSLAFFCPCCNSFSVAIPWTLTILSPVITIFVTSLVTSSVIMAYYVPLIPFIVFTFSGIGWLISIIEAVVAAPIVALGILHPEGHEVYGKAEPAVMLLVNTFLKPVLLIIGFIAASELVVIAVTLVNTAFALMIPQMLSGYLALFITTVALVSVYTIILWAATQKSFTLVHALPDRALRWIGHYDQFGIGPSENELQMGKRSLEETGGKAGKASTDIKQAVRKGKELKDNAADQKANNMQQGSDNSIHVG